MPIAPRKSLLLVANWDSNVGYAWWLMESFWVVLANQYAEHNSVILAYPSISHLPEAIQTAPLVPVVQKLGEPGFTTLLRESWFLRKHNIKAIYLSDRTDISLRYLIYRLSGVHLIIVHDHTPGSRTSPSGLKRLIKWALQRMPYIHADGVIGASEYVRRRFIEVNCIPAVRCFTAPNGLPEYISDQPATAVRRQFGIPKAVPIAVMTGRANHYKNIRFVLDCLAILKQQGRQLHFLFCGDGPDLADLKRTAEDLGIADRVTFTGRRNDIPELLPQCNFAVHPSKGEVGYSLSILEYMRAGLPVIVPDNPSVCEATSHGETGLIYHEGNRQKLINAIIQLLDNPIEAARMGMNAQTAVREKFNLQNTHTALLTAFEQIDHSGVLQQSEHT